MRFITTITFDLMNKMHEGLGHKIMKTTCAEDENKKILVLVKVYYSRKTPFAKTPTKEYLIDEYCTLEYSKRPDGDD